VHHLCTLSQVIVGPRTAVVILTMPAHAPIIVVLNIYTDNGTHGRDWVYC